MRIEIDEPKCIASGACVFEAPDVFDQRDEDGVVVVLDPQVAVEHEANVERAAAVCPASVILLHRE